MPNGNKTYFELLKQKIVVVMQQSYPGINPNITEWKGQEITDFQEELQIKVNANISEKWFYNHIKTQNQTLPRIDVLNLLSRYAGYANWDDFVFKNTIQVSPSLPTVKPSSGNRFFIIVPIMAAAILLLIFIVFKIFNTREYRFSFYDTDTKEAIKGEQIEVKLLPKDQSSLNFLSDSNGVCKIKTDESEVKMVVSAPYYKSDTITRILKRFDPDQKIGLHANDYALIIHYFSEKDVDDWQKRRASLDTIFDERAMIYQVLNDDKTIGTELFNKQEFIDKLTLPTGSLKHIEILDTKFKNGRIMLLRFRIQEK